MKRDDLTNDGYGGNKVRKLEILLSAALASGHRRIVTVGAAGSHHVLATAYFGRQVGLEVEAILVPQPRTPHVSEVLRAGLGMGLRAFPAARWAMVPPLVLARMAAGAVRVPIGGSSIAGAMGYLAAARELANQVRSGAMPEPDVCVVALGSGGTAAGLAAGFAAEGMKTRVVGVCVAAPTWLTCLQASRLARACAKRAGRRGARAGLSLSFDVRFLGSGYGYATEYGANAAKEAGLAAGLTLEPTYTAKTFAAALWQVRARRARTVLYWHTFSSAPMQPLLANAPPESALPLSLRRLMTNPAP